MERRARSRSRLKKRHTRRPKTLWYKGNKMKLLVFVTDANVTDTTVDALVEQGFRVTRLASTGGFLRKGNTTLLVGVEENVVDRAISVARRTAPGALVITLDLERYERL